MSGILAPHSIKESSPQFDINSGDSTSQASVAKTLAGAWPRTGG